MNWTELIIYTSTEGIEIVTSRLMDIGITGFVIKDKQDFEDFLQHKDGNWDYVDDDLMELRECETSITVYLTDDADGAEQLSLIKHELSELSAENENGQYGRLVYELSGIREEDWANNWKQYFKPIEIGQKLLVKPSWEQTQENETRKILEIDPATSFGTGQHNTTRLCLELLEKNISQGDTLLDLGCGSGILSIGALILGAKSAYAVDIEENAAVIAMENALKNGIDKDRYTAVCGNIIDDEELRERIGNGYDVVCANIVADVLIAMSPYFMGFVRKGGKLVVSGIIEKRRDEVVSAIAGKGFVLIEENQRGDWIACSFDCP